MSPLRYDELEVLECLGALPDYLYEDYTVIGARYRTEHSGLALVVSFWNYEGCIEVSLCQSGRSLPLIELALYVRGRIERRSEHYRDGTWRDYLLLTECVLSPSRYARPAENEPGKLTVELSAYPAIEIRFW